MSDSIKERAAQCAGELDRFCLLSGARADGKSPNSFAAAGIIAKHLDNAIADDRKKIAAAMRKGGYTNSNFVPVDEYWADLIEKGTYGD